MTEATIAAAMRLERITHLLHELEYEITRGIMEREIDERLSFRFLIPVSQSVPDGVVMARFHTRPTSRIDAMGWHDIEGPKLKLVSDRETP